MSEPDKTEETVSVNAVTKILQALGIGHKPNVNERGEDDDFRQMVADLISDDRSPFVPNDEESLRYMSYDTLKKMRDDYLGDGVAANKNKASEEDDAEDETDEGGQDMADKEKVKDNAALPTTRGELDTLIANAVAAGVSEALKTNSGLTTEQTEALNSAMKLNADHRSELITRITTNSDMTEDMVKAWPTAQLEVVANGLRAPANYGGRGTAPVVNAAEDDIAVNAMIPTGLSFGNGKEKVN